MPNPEQPILDQVIAHMDEFLKAMRRLRFQPSPHARYGEHVQLEPGARVGWVDVNGVLHEDTVRDHREDPPGSGRWVITVEDTPRADSSLSP